MEGSLAQVSSSQQKWKYVSYKVSIASTRPLENETQCIMGKPPIIKAQSAQGGGLGTCPHDLLRSLFQAIFSLSMNGPDYHIH